MKTIYLGISLALALFSSGAIIRLFSASFAEVNSKLWYPIVGNCVGIIFGILATIDKDRSSCAINAVIFITFMILVANIFLVFGLIAFMAQMAA